MSKSLKPKRARPPQQQIQIKSHIAKHGENTNVLQDDAQENNEQNINLENNNLQAGLKVPIQIQDFSEDKMEEQSFDVLGQLMEQKWKLIDNNNQQRKKIKEDNAKIMKIQEECVQMDRSIQQQQQLLQSNKIAFDEQNKQKDDEIIKVMVENYNYDIQIARLREKMQNNDDEIHKEMAIKFFCCIK